MVKAWIHLFYPQLWANSKEDWIQENENSDFKPTGLKN